MKDIRGLEMLTPEEYQLVRLAAKIEYETGGFPEEALALMDDIPHEHLFSHVVNLSVPNMGHYPDSITSVMIALFQDCNSKLRETIESFRNHRFRSLTDYLLAVSAAASIHDLTTIYFLLISGHSVNCKGSSNRLVIWDDLGRLVHIDAHAAQRRAAIAAQLTVYNAFADPEEIMNFDIEFHAKMLHKMKVETAS